MPLFQNKLCSITAIFFFFLFYSINILAQLPDKPEKEIVGDPLFFIDGKEMLKSEMANVNANDIATVTVLKDGTSKKYGEKGKNGVVLIETKVYCRQRFQHYLSEKSAEYKKILSEHSNDQNIQYILNEKVLKCCFWKGL